MIAYKLFNLRKDNTIGPLFINRKQIIPYNTWLDADCYPTKGFKVRKGWHVTEKPVAPHLSMKNRVWKKVLIEDYVEFNRPVQQGGKWLVANKMKVIG
jgi:hypothetical protein